MNNWLHVHSFCRGSRDLAFPGKILQEVREEKLQLKDLDFSQIKYHLTKGFLNFFHKLFHPFREQQLGKDNFHLRWQRPLSFREVYFQTS